MGLKFGIVSQVDESRGLARVRFGDNEGLESYWLHVLAAATMRNKVYQLPDVGEGVACHVDEQCENGVILGALYSKQDIPPVSDVNKFHVRFDDGTWLEYDRTAHALKGDVKGCVDLETRDDVRITTQASLSVMAGKDVTIDAGRVVVSASQGIDLRTPRVSVDSKDGSGGCDTDWSGAMRLAGPLVHEGDYTHTGDQFNAGDVTATGTIMDSSGNSNHHSH